MKACLVCGLTVVALLPAGMARGQDPESVDFYHDFRKQPLPSTMSLLNDPSGELCRFEPEGLRITVPKSLIYKTGDGVGVRALIPLRGDFEVTAGIELLDAETPGSGAGAGVALYLPTVTGTSGAFLGRVVDMNGRHIIMCGRHSSSLEKAAPTWERHPTPCSHRTLSLRLTRTGTRLFYQFASDNDRTNYEELHRCEFNGDDIKLVRFSAINNRTHCALDIRLLDLHIRSGANIVEPVALAPEPNGTGHRVVTVAILSLILILATTAAWLYRSLTRRAAPKDSDHNA